MTLYNPKFYNIECNKNFIYENLKEAKYPEVVHILDLEAHHNLNLGVYNNFPENNARTFF